MGGWKRIGTFANIYFCSFCLLLPPIFNKNGEYHGNGLIDVAEKPKMLKRFWQRRSRVILNSRKNTESLFTTENAFFNINKSLTDQDVFFIF